MKRGYSVIDKSTKAMETGSGADFSIYYDADACARTMGIRRGRYDSESATLLHTGIKRIWPRETVLACSANVKRRQLNQKLSVLDLTVVIVCCVRSESSNDKLNSNLAKMNSGDS